MKWMHRATMVTALAASLSVGAARAQTTTGNVTWSGGGGAGDPGWDVPANWLGGQAPASPTPGIVYFSTNGQSVVGLVETDRHINSLRTLDATHGQTMSHTIDLGGNVLTVTNRLHVQGSSGAARHIVLTNGTVRLTDNATLYVHMCDLTVRTNTVLDAQNLDRLEVSAWLNAHTIANLRNADLAERRLKARTLYVSGGRTKYARLYLNAATAIDRIEATHAFTLGDGFQENQDTYIGNPSDPFTIVSPIRTHTFGRFPAGIDLVIGEWGVQRASMLIARDTSPNSGCVVALRVAPGGGGSFTGYISTLQIAIATGATINNQWRPWGFLDLREMDSCNLDIQSLTIAPGHPNGQVHANDNYRGELWLPPGTATVGTVSIGSTNTLGLGVLVTSNTAFSVTNTMTLRKTAQVTCHIGATSSGLNITNADPGAFAIESGATLTLRFNAPAGTLPHVGFRWTGDHRDELEALLGSRLIVDSSGLENPAEVFLFQGATCIGIPPPRGAMLLVR